MKRILLIFSTIFIIFIMTACSIDKANPIIIKDVDATSEKIEDDNINFEVQQTILSKGFQNLDPKVEILKTDDGFRILASLGLLETSGVEITDINKLGDEISIHVENLDKKKSNQLAIPQVIIELKELNLRASENYKFKIINENYTPLKTKLSANDVINKVNSDFQIVTNTSPETNILKEKDSLFWELNYKNILDKYNLETPVINISVIVDANNGEMIKSSKNFISTLIDEGSILDYIPNEYVLYKKYEKTILNENKWIELLKYNIEENNREVLYSTNSEILSAQYNPKNDSIAIIESSNGNNQLFVLTLEDKKAYKATLDSQVNPSMVRWKDNENLYILSKTDLVSTIYNYNIHDTTINLVHYMYSDIVGMQVMDDENIIIVKDKDTAENSVMLTSNWLNFTIKEEGHLPKFLNGKHIGYLRFDEKNNSNNLVILNKDTGKKHSTIDLNVSNFFSIDDDTIGVISINSNNNDYTFNKYNLKNKQLDSIANITSDKVYYNSENKLLYIDLKVPFESNKPQIIFSLDLNKVNPIGLWAKE